jgi:hypothetical protein
MQFVDTGEETNIGFNPVHRFRNRPVNASEWLPWNIEDEITNKQSAGTRELNVPYP